MPAPTFGWAAPRGDENAAIPDAEEEEWTGKALPEVAAPHTSEDDGDDDDTAPDPTPPPLSALGDEEDNAGSCMFLEMGCGTGTLRAYSMALLLASKAFALISTAGSLWSGR